MRLVINKPDSVVGIDGVFVQLDLENLPSHIRAVQWVDGVGHIENFDLSVTVINDISNYLYLVDLHKKTLITKNTRIKPKITDKKVQEYLEITEDINLKFSPQDKNIVNLILSSSWNRLTISEKIREVDGVLIGVNIDYISAHDSPSGVLGFLAVRRLFLTAKKYGVPIFADLMPKGVDKEHLSVFLENLGATVIRNSQANYMYTEIQNG